MAGEKKYIALEATSQEIRAIGYNTANRIGDTPDETGGSATEGTVFAKLNKLIEQLTTVLASVGSDSSNTEKTLHKKIDNLDDDIIRLQPTYLFYPGEHLLGTYAGGTENFTFTITPSCSGKITVMATLTGKSTSSSKPAVELKADGTTILSITNSSSVETATKTAVLAVTAGTAVEIAGVMIGYRTGITDIKFMADVLPSEATVTIG
jgi:hypothetical protein